MIAADEVHFNKKIGGGQENLVNTERELMQKMELSHETIHTDKGKMFPRLLSVPHQIYINPRFHRTPIFSPVSEKSRKSDQKFNKNSSVMIPINFVYKWSY
jgi:hypothetical protein